MANALPSSSMLGHEMFTSMALTPSTVTSAQSAANSSTVLPEMLTTSGVA